MITEGSSLADAWPATADGLRRYLRSRGAAPQDVEDVLQECAIRVLGARPSFDSPADLTRWCIPVVRNLWVDLYRRERRETPVERVPERPASGDVADHVSHTLELGRVLHALQQLQPSDREVIVAHVECDEPTRLDRKAAVRLNVQRHRARQRLLARLAAVLGLAWAAARRTSRLTAPAALSAAMALTVFALDTGTSAAPSAQPAVAVSSALRAAAAPAQVTTRATRDAGRQVSARRVSTTRPASQRPATTTAVVSPTGERAYVSIGTHRSAEGALICVHDVAGVQQICITKVRVRASSR